MRNILALTILLCGGLDCQPPPPEHEWTKEEICDVCLADDEVPIAYCEALCREDGRARW